MLAALIEAARADRGVAELRVTGSAADDPAGMDGWSDVDIAVAVHPTAVGRVSGDVWLSQFGRVWTVGGGRRSGALRRVVYADGRRLDLLVVTEASRLPPGSTLLGPRPAAAEPAGPAAPARPDGHPGVSAVRFDAALAVVKYARGDLLIGTHLSLQLVQACLVQAMRLRDRELGTTTHRHGSHRDVEVARLDRLRRHGWTATGGLALIEDAAAAYDRLTGELDPDYIPDWTGLHALLAQARRPQR
ncbi:MAG: aminoglycoside 6-adenylyltransferase [Mycobacteriales bacterium]